MAYKVPKIMIVMAVLNFVMLLIGFTDKDTAVISASAVGFLFLACTVEILEAIHNLANKQQ